MSFETATALIKNAFTEIIAGDHMTFAFQGGEPSLAGLNFFRFFVNEVKKYTPHGVTVDYAFQTNGVNIDDEWCDFFSKNNFLVGLSLDGDSSIHNQNRLDKSGKGTFNKVMETKRKFDKTGVKYNILSVLTGESARRAGRIWNFILNENIRHIQFIPCLGPIVSLREPLDDNSNSTHFPGTLKSAEVTNMSNTVRFPGTLTGKRFYRFYSDLFPLWKKEAKKGNMISIRLFEDLAALLLTNQRVTCGISGRCMPQIIVEADGSVYPCDFYVLDEYKTGDFTRDTIREVFEATVNSAFLVQKPQSLKYCENCNHKKWCMGGCKRMLDTVYGDPCGMRLFLDEHIDELLKIYSHAM